MKLLVVTIQNYQDIEMNGFLGTLNRSGKLEKVTYWNPDGLSKVSGSNKIGYIETVSNEIDVDNYDAIFVPGGASCINLRTNKKALDLIKKFVNKDKWIFAICDAPNALVDNKILNDKNYSSYPIPNIEKVASKTRNKEYVTVHEKYITGKGPSASIDLGLKVIEVVFGKALFEKAKNEVYAIEK